MYAMFNLKKRKNRTNDSFYLINMGQQQRNQVIKYEILLSLLSASIDAHLHAGKNTLLFKPDQLLTFPVRTFLIPFLIQGETWETPFPIFKRILKKKKNSIFNN